MYSFVCFYPAKKRAFTRSLIIFVLFRDISAPPSLHDRATSASILKPTRLHFFFFFLFYPAKGRASTRFIFRFSDVSNPLCPTRPSHECKYSKTHTFFSFVFSCLPGERTRVLARFVFFVYVINPTPRIYKAEPRG